MTALEFSASIHVRRSPHELYELVSDITRMGEWSPICKACWWDAAVEGTDTAGAASGAPPARVGAWFTGRNQTTDRVWETRSQVVAADPGRAFAFEVGEGYVRWEYGFAPADSGTMLTESWQFLPAGLDRFAERFGDDAPAQIAERSAAAHRGIPLTLAAIKATAEAG